MGIETNCNIICPQCEGGLMRPISDTKEKCERCGYEEKDEITN